MLKSTLKLALLLAASTPATATVRTVCSSGCNYTTIQAAVTAASAGDTIHVNVNGTHSENGITISKSLTFKGNGITTTTVDGSDAGRIFLINPSTASTITVLDMGIQNGMAPSAGDILGGGAYIYPSANTTVTFRNVRFFSNELSGGGASGGALAVAGAVAVALNVYNCEFKSNRATGQFQTCAGISLSGSNTTGTIASTLFDDNIADGTAGALFWSNITAMNIVNCTFSNNKSLTGQGGASYSGSTVPTFTNCSFINNSASTFGGAVRCGGGTFTNCTFYGNTAATGAAISRSTNTAANALTLVNCTVAGNTASTIGGGLHFASTNGTTPLRLVNSILANNTCAASPSNADLYLASASVLTTNATNYVGANNAGTTFLSGTLALAATPTSGGGLTQTLALQFNSALINAGTASGVSGVNIPEKDQRNFIRDGVLSVGSYEYNGSDALSISYTQLGDALASSIPTLSATIADPIGVASGSLKPRIYFRKGSSGDWRSAAGTLASGTAQNGTWDFTIDQSLLGALTTSDVVEYFVAAQDQTSGAVVKSQAAGASAGDVANLGAAPSSPNAYNIVTALPVTLMDFNGRTAAAGNILTWETAREAGTTHFEVERSTDGRSFGAIGKTAATGKGAQYSFTDTKAPGTAYYRLKTMDADGSFEYSKTVVLSRAEAFGFTLAVHPNPAGEYLWVRTSGAEEGAKATLTDLTGKVLAHSHFDGGATRFDMTGIPAGIYLLRYQDAGHTQTVKVMKQ